VTVALAVTCTRLSKCHHGAAESVLCGSLRLRSVDAPHDRPWMVDLPNVWGEAEQAPTMRLKGSAGFHIALNAAHAVRTL
jgi:hypothetical protein